MRDRLALARLYVAAGDAYAALQLIVVPYSGILARGIDPELVEMWSVAWPRPYAALVRGAATGDLEAGLVWSVMREESAFRPAVESITGAIGLLQIQPETGSRLAEQVGLAEFEPRSLADPAVNVRLGAHYLQSLSDRFDGELAAAIASYNAGPHVVKDWIVEGQSPGSDLWIESIPYTQTRKYVKRVLRSLVIYRALEAHRAPAAALETGSISPKASPGEADTDSDESSTP